MTKNLRNKRPNLVFVFADQMRGQDMNCAGNKHMITPNMDKMADQGVRLSNAISSTPICTPARAMMLTGQYPMNNGVRTNGERLPLDSLTIAKVAKSVGYQTAYIGKWHLSGHAGHGVVSSQFIPPGPGRQGFDYWAAANILHRYFDSYYYRDEDHPIPIKGWEPDTQTDLAISYMKKHANDDKPFCLYLSWGPPHDPYVAPQKYLDLYDPETIKLRDNVFLADKKILQAYYAAITSLDWNLGRLMETMNGLDIADDTIFVFTSDHGDQLFSLYLNHKQWPYEETINIPFIIQYPRKIPAGKVNDVLLGTPDIMPTLLSLMDVDIPSSVDGDDLSSVINGKSTEPERDSVLIGIISPNGVVQDRTGMRPWRGIRTKRYTFARFKHSDWLLIDNKLDPFQRRNLIYNSEYKVLREDLASELDEWLKKTNDPFPEIHEAPRYEMVSNRPPLWKPGMGEI
jgi:arylsulfatase A-like enzyme